MQVSTTNDVRIYNLSAGKSLPDWISERKKRQLVKQDIDIRRRIELIQDLDMPAISDNIKVSKDGHYVLATGIYKPRLKCYDLHNLGMKFERCLDAEVVTFQILSDDYSKIVFLHCDRYVEFHSQQGRYYRLRIPKFGRDMAYDSTSCDLFFATSSHEIYRLNLEQGRFLNSWETEASSLNCISINPDNNLVCVGSSAGKIEAWDQRTRNRVGVLDCALQAVAGQDKVTKVPAVTCIKFRDGLNMGVGTSTGQTLLYDLRSSKPLRVKDHMYGLPIKKLEFHTGHNNDLVLSMDAQVVKLWDRETGKPYTSIEATADFNDLCVYKQSGLMFIANEQPKMQVFYIPSLGPAPKWASFLDSLTEELEESRTATVYDDYKFVTNDELTDLGLEHLIGSPLLRAHMHGYYMDVRLYRKALSAKAPNRMETLKRDLIKGEIEKARAKRVQLLESRLPAVNKDLFLKKKQENTGNILLEDDRFANLFTDKNFEVDTNEETYRLLNPVVSKLDKDKRKKAEEMIAREEMANYSDEEMKNSGDSDIESQDEQESSDDDQEWTREMKREHKSIQAEKRAETVMRKVAKQEDKIKRVIQREHKFREMEEEEGDSGTTILPGKAKTNKKKTKMSLEERLAAEGDDFDMHHGEVTGGMTATFKAEKSRLTLRQEADMKRHIEERREVRRSAKSLKKDRLPPRFWMGKRVR